MTESYFILLFITLYITLYVYLICVDPGIIYWACFFKIYCDMSTASKAIFRFIWHLEQTEKLHQQAALLLWILVSCEFWQLAPGVDIFIMGKSTVHSSQNIFSFSEIVFT